MCYPSPSMRREWIEIHSDVIIWCIKWQSPSMRREWIEISNRLDQILTSTSPSMRREWIEMM